MTPDEALKYFADLKTAYQTRFGNAQPNPVMDDLMTYCHATRSCFHTDAGIERVLLGRNQVYLRIKEFLDLTPEQLVALNTRPAEGAISHAPRSNDD